MPRKKTHTIHNVIENKGFNPFIDQVEYLKQSRKTFTIEKTGYTYTIIYNQFKEVFFTNRQYQNGKLFSLAGKVRKDIRDSNIVIDHIPEYFIDYFDVRKKIKSLPDTIINVDIKSAYLTTLLRSGLITENTFKELNRATKMERLKAVGMLATNKLILKYEKGKLISHEWKNNPDERNIFFYISYKIDQIMNELKKSFFKDYLFYWVDGIYFKKTVEIEKVKQYFDKKGYQFKAEILNDIHYSFKNNNLYIDYQKENECKTFTIPLSDKSVKKEIQLMFEDEIKRKHEKIH